MSRTAPSRLLPAVFTVGEVVSETVDVDDLLDSKHRWETTLETGRYRVVLESRRGDGEIAGIGLNTQSFLDGELVGLRLTDTDEIDRRFRETGVLTIGGPEGASAGFLVEVSPKYGPDTYHLAILEEKAVVPVPYFVDCPDIAALALDTTESLSLGTIGQVDTERWFSFSKPAGGEYFLSIAASRDTGIASEIGMEINFFDSLGGIQPTIDDQRIIDRFATNVLDQIDVFIRESSDSTQQGDPAGFVRLRSVGEELNIELTLNRTATTP